MSYKALLCTVAAVLTLAHSSVAIDCNNQHFRESLIGVRSYLKYQGYAYNFGFDFENTIATKFFQGFKSIGQLGLYMSMYEAVKGTEGGVSNYIAYFQSIVSNIMGSTCEWLKTYGQTFTLREVDCSDPNELVLLASYIGTYTDIVQLLDVLSSDNGCNVVVSDVEMEVYLNQTTPAGHMPVKTELKALHDSFVNGLLPPSDD